MMGATRSREQQESPLQGDRGQTTIASAVVSSIVGMVLQEAEGLGPELEGNRIPGDTSPTLGEFFDGITGSGGRTRGVSVEVGERQAAIDLIVKVAYGNPIPRVTGALRDAVIQHVEGLTGLEVTEVNISVADVITPDR
jgi:uncharacterized alkaline shock family protein YloU